MTVAGLAAAVATSTALLSSAWSFAASSNAYYSSRGIDVVVVRAGVSERITSSLSAASVGRLRELPDVADAEGSLTEMVSLGERALIGIPMHGVDPAGLTAQKARRGSRSISGRRRSSNRPARQDACRGSR